MEVTWTPPTSWDDMELDAQGVPLGGSARNMEALLEAICERRNALGLDWGLSMPGIHAAVPSYDTAAAMAGLVLGMYGGYTNYTGYLKPGRPARLDPAVAGGKYDYDYDAVNANYVGPEDLDAEERNFMAAMPGRGDTPAAWGEWMRRMRNALDYLHVRFVAPSHLVLCRIGAAENLSAAGHHPGDDGNGRFESFGDMLDAMESRVDDLIAAPAPAPGEVFYYRQGSLYSGTTPDIAARLRATASGTRAEPMFSGSASAGCALVLGVRSGYLPGRSAALLVARLKHVGKTVFYGTPYYGAYAAAVETKIEESADVAAAGTLRAGDGCLFPGGAVAQAGWTGIGWLRQHATPTPQAVPADDEPSVLLLEAGMDWFALLDHGAEGGFRFYADTYPTASEGPIT